MSSLPITEVTAGDNLGLSYSASVRNVALAIAPPGFFGVFGLTRIYDAQFNGAGVDHLFSAAYAAPHAYNVDFSFGSSLTRWVYPWGLDEEFSSYSTRIRNAAQAAWVQSVAPGIPGRAVVYDVSVNGGAVDLDFTGSYTPWGAANVAFYFGVGPLPIVATLGLSEAFGQAYFESTWAISPASLSVADNVGQAFMYAAGENGVNVNFDFVDAYTPPTPYVHLTYGGLTYRVHHRAPWVGVVSLPRVTNAAQAAYPAGFASSYVNSVVRLSAPAAHKFNFPGGMVVLPFSSAYTPMTAQNVAFYFSLDNDVFVAGWRSSSAPWALDVGYRIRTVVPLSWPSSWIGLAAAEKLLREVHPTSVPISASAFGQTEVINVNRTVLAGGVTRDTQYGTPSIVLADQVVVVEGIDAFESDKQYIAFYYQQIKVPQSVLPDAEFGTPKAEYLNRYVSVETHGIKPQIIYAPWVGRRIVLAPMAWESSLFGDAILLRGRQLLSEAWLDGELGALSIRTAWRRLTVAASNSNSYVEYPLDIFNLLQFLRPYHEVQDVPLAAGRAAVLNVNRTMPAFGWRSSNFSFYPADLRQPYQVIPEGIAPHGVQRPIQIAYRIRYFPMAGWLSSVSERWHVAYNTARQVFPVGAPTEAAVDRPESVINLNREFRMRPDIESHQIGTQFVAYRVRRVAQWFPYEGGLGGISGEVRWNPWPIAPNGIDNNEDRHAAPWVEEHFTIARCWGIQPGDDFVSPYATVANRNRTVTPHPRLPMEFGRTWFSHWVRYLYPPPYEGHVFGRNAISDNKQYPQMSPAQTGSFIPVTHRLEYTIVLWGTPRKLFHISGATSSAIGGVVFKTWTLRLDIGIAPGLFGQHRVKSNAIFPDEIIPNYAGQVPAVNVIGPRRIRYVGKIPSSWLAGRPRFSPYNIYATGTAPPPDAFLRQYKANNTGESYEPISPRNFDVPNGTWVANKNRTMFVWAAQLAPATALGVPYPGPNIEWFGTPWASNRRRYISPTGFRRGRFGIHILPHTVWLEPRGINSLAFGDIWIGRPEDVVLDNTIRPRGWISDAFPNTNFIENFNRTVGPPAAFVTPNVRLKVYNYTTRSYSETPPPYITDTQPPTVVNPSYVGPPVPLPIPGIAGAEPQVFQIAYRIRNVYPEGQDLLDMRYRITMTNPGMSVRRASAVPPSAPPPPAQSLILAGFDTLSPSGIPMRVPTPNLYNQRTYVYSSGTFTSARLSAPTCAHG